MKISIIILLFSNCWSADFERKAPINPHSIWTEFQDLMVVGLSPHCFSKGEDIKLVISAKYDQISSIIDSNGNMLTQEIANLFKLIMKDANPDFPVHFSRFSLLLMKLNKSSLPENKVNDWSTILVHFMRDILFPRDVIKDQQISENIGAILNALIEIIYSDAEEEVIGQERPPGSITRMFFESVNPQKGKDAIVLKNQKIISQLNISASLLNEILSKLYPFAILAVHHSDRGQVHKRAASKDLTTYYSEMNGLFGEKIFSTNYRQIFKGTLNQFEKEAHLAL